MTDIATLGIKVTTDGVKEATTDLDKLGTSAKKTETSLGGSSGGAGTGPGLAPAMRRTAKSAKELQFAARGLPAQFTDIATSLSSGQRPMQVLLQQGGQIKDMFGGVGPAIRAMGGYLAGLINPVTILAGVTLALGLAWKQGSDEAVAFNKALTLTGDYAGKTAAQLQEMSRELSESLGTQHEAAEALAEITSSGRFTADQLELVGSAALSMSRLTGQATSETIKQFTKLQDEPVKAIIALDEQYHFLTTAVYEQIKALEDQGRTQEAVTLGMATFSREMADRSQEVIANAGYIERAWHAVASAAKSAWDEMLNIGRASTPLSQANLRIATEQSRLFSIRNNINVGLAAGREFSPEAIAAYKRDIARSRAVIAEAKRAINEDSGALQAARKATSQQAVAAAIALDQEAASYAGREAKRVKAITKARGEANEAIKLAMKAGNVDLVKSIKDDLAVIEKGINEQFKAPKGPKGRKPKAAGVDPSLSIIARIKEQIALNAQEQLSVEKLTASERLALAVKFDLEKIGGKLTSARKAEVAALLEELAASGKALAAFEKEAKIKEDLAQLTVQLAAVEKNRRDANEIDLLAFGRGGEEVERMRRRLDIEREYTDGLRALRDSGVAETDESYRRQEILLRESRDRMLKTEEDFQQERVRQMGDWRNGARAAFDDFLSDAADVAGQTRTIFSNAFDGLTDVLTDFFTKGKADWKGYFDSIAAQITAFVIKQQLAKLMQSATAAPSGGAGEGSGWGAIIKSIFGAFGGGSANGNAFVGGHVQAFANGGILDRPTFFGMAGNKFGVGGEAGTEAILPLHRGPDGKLGVRMADNDDGPRGRVINNTTTFVLPDRWSPNTQAQVAQGQQRAASRATSRNS